ncbi:MAG: DUF2156 domain-containing protein [Desulfobacteraceae bacterium]|nr:MAG: DUF2156 domain-containing protein [Desulfobacteraceae bacterium]
MEAEFSFDERMSYMRKYGNHCMSFSTLQPGMKFFDVPDKGFIAYRPIWGAQLVLSDPVCDPENREQIIRAFLQKYPNSAFIQITEPVAGLMTRTFGCYATQFGIETIIDLESWRLSGKKKQILRTAMNQARNQNVEIRECREDEKYKLLSDRWITTRKIKNREVGFLIRPMDMAYQEETRKFFAHINDELIGFIFFDPVYQNGEIISYVPNISRFSHSFRQGIFYAIMVHAMETFRGEGLKELNLGLSMLVLDDKNMAYESKALKNIQRLVYRYGNFIYNFKGIEFTKSRFGGRENKFYCAHTRYLPVVKLLSVLKLSNVF